jgi:beta-fructofuranosidase
MGTNALGHAASEDLYHWRHYPVFLQPEQNLEALGATGGAFSGTAFQERDGKLRFWFTERLPAYDLYKGYREVQKCATPGPWLDKVESVKQVLSELPAGVGCDFRDPKVWFDGERNHYFMLLGASVDGDPAALLFTSADSDEWTFDHVLWRADSHFRNTVVVVSNARIFLHQWEMGINHRHRRLYRATNRPS